MLNRALLLFLIFPPAAIATHPPTQPELSRYEPVLIPIAVSAVPGAGGSVWHSVLKLYNSGERPASYFPGNCGSPSFICSLEPREIVTAASLSAGWPFGPGRLMYIHEQDVANVALSLHVQEQTLRSGGWGTEIPVVRRDEVQQRPVQLLNVPIHPRFRQTLRIFDVEGLVMYSSPKLVKVRIVSEDNILLHEAIYQFRGLAHEAPERPVVPGYIELSSLSGLFPAAAETLVVRVEIEPLSAGLKYWAFVSVTDNTTHEVTTFTPQ